MNFVPQLTYINDRLHFEGVDLELLMQKQGSPLYVYSHTAMTTQYQALTTAFASVDHLPCYSVKANPNKAILKTFFDQGAGADVVSGGELRRALWAGCPADRIVFSGVGKTSEEIHFALEQGIYQFNVESEAELLNLQRIGAFLDKKARIALRVNPDVDAKTHPYISTGLRCNKFGVSHEQALSLYEKARDMSHIQIQGIDCHIGSQLLDVTPFRDAMVKIRDLIDELARRGIELKTVDVGGGLGIAYRETDTPPSVTDYARAILEPLKGLKARILLEPGRFLVGNSGLLLSRVTYVKKNHDGKVFTIIDAAFNDLMRPMLYDAYHHIVPLVRVSGRNPIVTDVVGPICETTDSFASDREIAALLAGEAIAFLSAGAYGASMASFYNSRGRCAEVLVRGKEFFVIKKPDRLEDLVERESLPEFLKTKE